ncbi:MAG: HAD family hydrolase [Planctomycetes bacterium]|nr:HAD family hydrolase [Planctomycetota bacterium]
MLINLSIYKTWIFDCDGVLLDSNSIKTDAFYEVVLPYGKDKAERLANYHVQNGGISRFKKFRYFFEHILAKENFQKELDDIIKRFSLLVRAKLLQCNETEGLRPFLEKLSKNSCSRKLVVSGGMQEEIREVFIQRKLDHYFDVIYGSPAPKEVILESEYNQGKLFLPAVFIGDSKYDFKCASDFEFDFIFMSQYSEFKEWQKYFQDKNVFIIKNFKEL